MIEQNHEQLRGRHPLVIKWANWEFLPLWIVYIPVAFYFLWLSIKSRRLYWLRPINPAIENDGLFGWSKEQIQGLIPEDLLPLSIFFSPEDSAAKVLEAIENRNMTFPLIAKPNQGLRGLGVVKLWSKEAVEDYVNKNTVDYQIQVCVDAPVEAGVMFYKIPGTDKKGIHSITLKSFLSVTGDGVHTLGELVQQNPRALLVLDRLKLKFRDRWEDCLAKGEELLLEPIGNHNRGTRFYSGEHLKSPEMVEAYAKLTERIPGLNFCRYDIRCNSLEDLVAAKNLIILEINGSWSEPTHIYDNKLGLVQKYNVLFKQWALMYEIAKVSRSSGVRDLSFAQGLQLIWDYQSLKERTSTQRG